MSADKTKAAPKGTAAKAARAEVNSDPKPKKLDWGGLKLTLPAQLPRTTMYDMTMASADDENALPMYLLLQSIVGQEQFLQIRNRLAQDEKLDDSELLNSALKLYGITLGEAAASGSS